MKAPAGPKGPIPIAPALPPHPPAIRRAAQLQAAGHAQDTDDLAHLLEVLGLAA